jgi:hypothetical protein
MIYLNSFRPLISRTAGHKAARIYKLPPFIDGSCRREPDFQSQFPSITALCRFTKFAPRLHEDDLIAYITVKGKYINESDEHWRLVAILQVLKRFQSHKDAAIWYGEQGLSLPSNCMVEGNPPIQLDQTVATHETVEEWDRVYRFRAWKCPVFLACTALHLALHNPPIITADMMDQVFEHPPSTQNPPSITPDQFYRLKESCGLP